MYGSVSMMNPILPFLQQRGALILDGGLATELERRGYDLSDSLWSARFLYDAPDVIRQVHLAYYEAGADCCISSSYQATIPGFMGRGLPAETARGMIALSVRLVKEARDAFWSQPGNRVGRIRPLVAASVGPYGAYLADGSEYTGNYGLDLADLVEFHVERWGILAGSEADILACETIPSFVEAQALLRLLDEDNDKPAWFSFSCRDDHHISDGTPIAECAAMLADNERVVAIGINCTAPRFIPALIRSVKSATTKPIIVYPNSGEVYDPSLKQWSGQSVPTEFGALGESWHELGATLIGGCCRTTPAHIQQIKLHLTTHPLQSDN